MIALKALSCGYEQKVLQEITFESDRDLVILGANGAGKSTLAKALCGLLPYKGTLRIEDRSLETLSAQERARTITYIPPKLESYDTYITVLEFVLMGRHPYKAPFEPYSEADRSVALQLIAHHQLDPKKRIGELSSGQQQLLLITQALAQESRIIIFDEPTANLDPQHSLEFYRALRALDARTQKILITHDLNLAHRLGYEVLFIHEGSATHYKAPEAFFTPKTLKAAYGVDFTLEHGLLGVVYE